MKISEQTFCRWKKVYGGLGVGELRRLKLLEEENRKLKQLVADLSLDKHILQDVLAKCMVRPRLASADRSGCAVCVNVSGLFAGHLDPGP